MDCFVLMARMEFDDLPVRIFANEVCMLHWLQYSKLTFDADIDAVVESQGLSRSQLLRVEAWEYRSGELVAIKHVMGFEHLLFGSDDQRDGISENARLHNEACDSERRSL